MPATTRFLNGFYPWLKAEVSRRDWRRWKNIRGGDRPHLLYLVCHGSYKPDRVGGLVPQELALQRPRYLRSRNRLPSTTSTCLWFRTMHDQLFMKIDRAAAPCLSGRGRPFLHQRPSRHAVAALPLALQGSAAQTVLQLDDQAGKSRALFRAHGFREFPSLGGHPWPVCAWILTCAARRATALPDWRPRMTKGPSTGSGVCPGGKVFMHNGDNIEIVLFRSAPTTEPLPRHPERLGILRRTACR